MRPRVGRLPTAAVGAVPVEQTTAKPVSGESLVDVVLFFKAALMGIVEGLTEFLPISSTGHLILADSLLDFARSAGAEKAKVFEIAIQTGAIFAVILVYMQHIRDTLMRSGLSKKQCSPQCGGKRKRTKLDIINDARATYGLPALEAVDADKEKMTWSVQA